MNAYHKIANRKHEEEACATSRSVSKHGVRRGLKRAKAKRNRAAKRIDHANAFRLELEGN